MRKLDRVIGAATFVLLAACGGPAPPAEQAPAPILTPTPTGPMTSVRDLHLMPWPGAVRLERGTLPLAALKAVALSDPNDVEAKALARYTADLFRAQTGVGLTVSPSPVTTPPAGSVTLLLRKDEPRAHPEQYVLEVTPQSVLVSAPTHAGLFYGLQTLRQLLPIGGESPRALPAVRIDDVPRFAYRGMHLDVGRHFFPVAFVKRYIDLMAMYKMNTFHWHLTEDQGWRIAIEKYPRLTDVGSCRKETILEKNFDPYIGDGTPYCGFYTQDEIREVVAHARSRYVTVIPEIEMPGHSLAALAAYPEYACTPGPFEVATTWGVHADIYCPTEETFGFLRDVLSEVMDLFPGRYIHIGGDEAPKARWEESEIAQEILRREGLADAHELQSYFVSRIEQFLLQHDRRLIGWDEILEGGLAPEATVMSWRGTVGGIEAARQGHDVIMTPWSDVYFDYYQGDPAFEPLAIGGFLPLEQVYGFEPVPDELTPTEARHVLGAQGNVWTEYMKTTDYVEYMVFPRLLALSEVVWSPKSVRNWDHFVARLPRQFHLLDRFGVNYRLPPVLGLEEDRITLGDTVMVSLGTLTGDAEIRYTLNGSDPSATSVRYIDPLSLAVTADGVTVTARAFVAGGRASPARSATFRRATLQAPAAVDPTSLQAGLRYLYFEAEVARVDALVNHGAVAVGVSDDVAIPTDARDEHVGLVFSGYVKIDRDGIYTFHLTSDDGSTLHVGDRLVVNNDGPHGPSAKRGSIALAAGYHPITVGFFQGSGDKELRLEMGSGMEGEPRSLANRLFHEW